MVSKSYWSNFYCSYISNYTFGALKPLLNRILVPSAGVGASGAGMSEADLEPEEAEAEVEVQEGESIEDIKAKLKPKKCNFS